MPETLLCSTRTTLLLCYGGFKLKALSITMITVHLKVTAEEPFFWLP